MKEEIWIEKEKSLSPHGYNLTRGGDNRKLSEDSKEKMRESKRYAYEPIICLTNNKIYDNISIAARDLDLHPNSICYVVNGKTDTANKMKFEFVNSKLKSESEIIRIKRQEKTKHERSLGQEIICIENGKLYKAIKSAALDLNIKTSDINSFFSGRLIRAKNYTFKYVIEGKNTKRAETRKLKEFGKIQAGINGGISTQKPIVCVELNETFDSISLASRKLKIHRNAIRNMLAGRSKSAGGYTFKYL